MLAPHQSTQKAHESIMMRLINALVREHLLPDACQIEQLSAAASKSLGLRSSQTKLVLSIYHPQTDSCLFIPIRHKGTFNRFRFQGPMILRSKKIWTEISDLPQLLVILCKNFLVDLPTSLKKELLNSVENLIFAYQKWEEQRVSITSCSDADNFMEQLAKGAFGQLDEYLWSESMAIEGNPLHPGAKMRMGLSKSEQAEYAPEAGKEIGLKVLLIPKEQVCITTRLDQGVNQLLLETDPELKKAVKQTLQSRHQQLDNFLIFFVHPWQYSHILNSFYQGRQENWIHLRYQPVARSLLSFRTMAMQASGLHIKLPVRLQITNAVRTLSPQATRNGPRLSFYLNQLLAQQPSLSERLVVLPELAGVSYHAEADPDALLATNLAYTLRENPRRFIRSDGYAIVGAALTMESPLQSRPLIIDLIEVYTKKSMIGQAEAIAYLRHYADRCLPPLLYLLQHDGVALEGHMQNVILVFKEGEIQRVLLRDMGGVRLHRTRFGQAEALGLKAGAILVEEMQSVYKKFLHSVIQNQFGDLIFAISEYLQMDEAPLWQEVRKVMEQSFDQKSQYAEMDYEALFQPVIQTKSLLAMRQKQCGAHDYIYIDVQNPLARRCPDDAITS